MRNRVITILIAKIRKQKYKHKIILSITVKDNFPGNRIKDNIIVPYFFHLWLFFLTWSVSRISDYDKDINLVKYLQYNAWIINDKLWLLLTHKQTPMVSSLKPFLFLVTLGFLQRKLFSGHSLWKSSWPAKVSLLPQYDLVLTQRTKFYQSHQTGKAAALYRVRQWAGTLQLFATLV